MKDPELVNFLKGFKNKKPIFDSVEEAKIWFRSNYPGLFPSWKEYNEHKYDDVEKK